MTRGGGRGPARRRPARRARLAVAAALTALPVLLTATALAQTATRLLLERSDATITIVNAGRADEGARSILALGGCLDEPTLQSNLFYAPGGGVSARIEQDEGEPAVVEAPLVVVVRPDRSGDEDEAADEETLEALDATVTFGRPPCLETVEAADPPRVSLVQGRTTAVGARFFLDRGTDVASMDGPVTLRREAQGDGDPVEADAAALAYDLEAGRSILTGGVQVRSGERVSEADRLELDEEAGVAILDGAPAVSREGTDEVRGARLIYDLETNDVVVEGGVEATFEIEGEE